VTFFEYNRIGRVEERTARVGTGKILATLQKVFVRGWGKATIELFLSG
jgi:hypothetical protein